MKVNTFEHLERQFVRSVRETCFPEVRISQISIFSAKKLALGNSWAWFIREHKHKGKTKDKTKDKTKGKTKE